MVPTSHKVFDDLWHFQIISNFTSDLYSYFSPSLGNYHLATEKIFVPLMLFWRQSVGRHQEARQIDTLTAMVSSQAALSHVRWQKRWRRRGSISSSSNNGGPTSAGFRRLWRNDAKKRRYSPLLQNSHNTPGRRHYSSIQRWLKRLSVATYRCKMECICAKMTKNELYGPNQDVSFQ